METKELFIKVLNKAIEAYKAQKNLSIGGDVVVDYVPEKCRIASYLDRHPGWIKLPVLLEEGTGYIFLKVRYDIIVLAWEEDIKPHALHDLLEEDLVGMGAYITDTEYKELEKLISNIISQTIRRNL